jgi:hypothetical protein
MEEIHARNRTGKTKCNELVDGSEFDEKFQKGEKGQETKKSSRGWAMKIDDN